MGNWQLPFLKKNLSLSWVDYLRTGIQAWGAWRPWEKKETMEFKFQRSKAGTILAGIAAIILGVVCFMRPSNAALFITNVTGWILIIFGIVGLVTAFSHISIILSQLDFYSGLLSLLLGIMIVSWPQFFVAWIFILLGIYVMVAGFNTLLSANSLRLIGIKGSGGAIVAAILMVILGFMVMMSPFTMADVSMMIAGVALVYAGIVCIGDGVRMIKADKEE